VLQDNFLFRANIRDNITMTRPNAGFGRIVAAAALAGADEFIERLPKGFNTFIEENGGNLIGRAASAHRYRTCSPDQPMHTYL